MLRRFGRDDAGGGGADVGLCCGERALCGGHGGEACVLDGGGVFEEFEVDVFGPVWRYGGEEERLELDVQTDESVMHPDPGGFGGFAVRVPRACEVVEAGFERCSELQALRGIC